MSEEKQYRASISYALSGEQELQLIKEFLEVCESGWCHPYVLHRSNIDDIKFIHRECIFTVIFAGYDKPSSVLIEWEGLPSVNPIFCHFNSFSSVFFNFHFPIGYEIHERLANIVKRWVKTLTELEV